MEKYRRNASSRLTRSAPPYNELYQTFGKYFQPIFSERLSEGLRSKTYVNVPHAEEKLESYIHSDVPEICVMTGLMGSGKSSILEYYADKSREKTDSGSKTVFLYLNFQGRRFHFMPPEDFIGLSEDDRRIYARANATRRINELLLPLIKEHKALVNEAFFDYLYENNISEIGAEAVFAETEEEKIEIVKKFMAQSDKTAPIQCFLRYVAKAHNFQSFTIAVDNVDEQPFEMVEAIFYVLTDFIECMMRPRSFTSDSGDPYQLPATEGELDTCSTKFNAILACRSHTFEALKNEEGGIYQTRGSREIVLDAGAILGDILRSRLKFFRSVLEGQSANGADTSAEFSLRSGARVKLDDAFSFLNALIESLLDRAIELPLFDIFNHNYARSIGNIKYLIQNRYFIVFDHAVLSGNLEDADLKYHNVIKALGYGNPSNERNLYFPAQSSVLCNLLAWDPGLDRSLFAVIKFLKWLSASGFVSTNGDSIGSSGCSIAFARSVLSSEFGIPPETGLWAIHYCHRNGLIFAASGHKADAAEREMICLSPKGRVHLTEIFRTAVYFEMFIDDTFLPTSSEELVGGRQTVPWLGRHATRAHFRDTANWLRAFMDAERAFLDDLRRENSTQVANTLNLFGGKTVSHCLIEAIDGVWKSYYSNFCNKTDRAQMNDLIKLAGDMSRYFLQDG